MRAQVQRTPVVRVRLLPRTRLRAVHTSMKGVEEGMAGMRASVRVRLCLRAWAVDSWRRRTYMRVCRYLLLLKRTPVAGARQPADSPVCAIADPCHCFGLPARCVTLFARGCSDCGGAHEKLAFSA